MRVLPWNQSERAQQNTGGIPLATPKRESRGCASFICSWCASTGPDSLSSSSSSSSSSSKVEAAPPPNCQGDGSSMPPPASSPNPACTGDGEAANGDIKVSLKSSLKKKKPFGPLGMDSTRSPNRANAGAEQGISSFNCTGKRKVQWTDAHGMELAQVKEFELSESCGSDEEEDDEANQGCACVIQ